MSNQVWISKPTFTNLLARCFQVIFFCCCTRHTTQAFQHCIFATTDKLVARRTNCGQNHPIFYWKGTKIDYHNMLRRRGNSSVLSVKEKGSCLPDDKVESERESLAGEDDDGVVIPKDASTLYEAYIRGRWLLMLLVLQSSSGFILDKFQELIQKHFVVTLFLTMLVGAGGNAGNQSAIKVIQGFARGDLKPNAASFKSAMLQQAQVGVLIGAAMAIAGYLRVYLSGGSTTDATAISASLFVIVASSCAIGTGLPFGLARIGIDPANAGTTVQVIMDVFGVVVTCLICTLILDMPAAAGNFH